MVRIPSEYQEVEYLESTGTQWIDTGILTGQNLKILTKIRNTKSSSMYAYGVRKGAATITYANGFGTTTGYVRWGASVYSNSAPNGIAVIEQDGSGVVINGKTYKYYSYETVTPLDGYTIAIFAAKTTATDVSSNFVGEIYYFQIYDGDTPLRNFIPCYRKSDNEPGMYDTVSKTFFTNSGTDTFLIGNDVNYSNTNLLEVRRRILLNTPHIESMSGNPAIFSTDMAANLKECRIRFTPVQAGEGTPSPENVRPISGWDGVSVTRCGKNLFNKVKITPKNLINSIGEVTGNSSWFVTDYIPLYGTKVSCHGSRRANTTYHAFYDKDKQLVSVIKQEQTNNINIPLNAKYIRCSCANEYIDSFQVELSSTATSYEPYIETSISIPFPQTIFGGYVDLIKGEIVEEWTKRNLNAFSQTTISGGGFQIGHWLSSGWEKKNGVDNFISDVFKRVIGGTVDQTMKGYSNTYPILLYDRSIATVAEFKEKYADNYIVYAIRYPITYSLTPQTIKALKGLNNLYSDANGNIEVKFWKH